jgi:hypothetical protein
MTSSAHAPAATAESGAQGAARLAASSPGAARGRLTRCRRPVPSQAAAKHPQRNALEHNPHYLFLHRSEPTISFVIRFASVASRTPSPPPPPSSC